MPRKKIGNDNAEKKLLLDKSRKQQKTKEDPKQAPLYKAYKNYMKSKEWLSKRDEILDFYGHKCMLCGRSENDLINGKLVKLTVHHIGKTGYFNLGHETDDIINSCIVLCQGDHVFGAHRRSNWNCYKMPDKLTPELEKFLEKYNNDICKKKNDTK